MVSQAQVQQNQLDFMRQQAGAQTGPQSLYGGVQHGPPGTHVGWSGGGAQGGLNAGLSMFSPFNAGLQQQRQTPTYNIFPQQQQQAAPRYRQTASQSFVGPQFAPTVGTVSAPGIGAPGTVSAPGVSAPAFSFNAGTPMGGPNIQAGPVWNQQQIQQRVNQMRGSNDASTRTQQMGMQSSLAGRGFGGNSPLAQALGAQMGAANLMANTQGENDLRWNAAEGNAQNFMRGQSLQEQQAGRMDSSQIARGGQTLQAGLGNQAAQLQASIANSGNQLRASDANASNQLQAMIANSGNQLRASEANAGNQLQLGLNGMQQGQIDQQNKLLAALQGSQAKPGQRLSNNTYQGITSPFQSLWSSFGA